MNSGEQRPDGIEAGDVQPGMIVWNPYGGRLGRMVVASEVRQRDDGNVEFDVSDGRTARFRPHFLLRPDWRAMDAAAEQPETGS